MAAIRRSVIKVAAMKRLTILAAFAAFLAVACDENHPSSAPAASSAGTTAAPAAAAPKYGDVDRETFNRLAVRLNLPVYWATDADKDNAVSPAEVRALLFYGTDAKWVEEARSPKPLTTRMRRSSKHRRPIRPRAPLPTTPRARRRSRESSTARRRCWSRAISPR